MDIFVTDNQEALSELIPVKPENADTKYVWWGYETHHEYPVTGISLLGKEKPHFDEHSEFFYAEASRVRRLELRSNYEREDVVIAVNLGFAISSQRTWAVAYEGEGRRDLLVMNFREAKRKFSVPSEKMLGGDFHLIPALWQGITALSDLIVGLRAAQRIHTSLNEMRVPKRLGEDKVSVEDFTAAIDAVENALKAVTKVYSI